MAEQQECTDGPLKGYIIPRPPKGQSLIKMRYRAYTPPPLDFRPDKPVYIDVRDITYHLQSDGTYSVVPPKGPCHPVSRTEKYSTGMVLQFDDAGQHLTIGIANAAVATDDQWLRVMSDAERIAAYWEERGYVVYR